MFTGKYIIYHIIVVFHSPCFQFALQFPAEQTLETFKCCSHKGSRLCKLTVYIFQHHSNSLDLTILYACFHFLLNPDSHRCSFSLNALLHCQQFMTKTLNEASTNFKIDELINYMSSTLFKHKTIAFILSKKVIISTVIHLKQNSYLYSTYMSIISSYLK